MAVNPMQYTPTLVSSSQNVIPLNSPFYVSLTNPTTSSFTEARLKLWVWDGGLDEPYTNVDEPNLILYKDKVSGNDTSILFELSDYIKDLFTPSFIYSNLGLPTASNEAVYFKYEYDIINNPGGSGSITPIFSTSSNTYMGTQGINWNYEDINEVDGTNMSFGFYSLPPAKNYDPAIKYSQYDFDLNASSSFNLVVRTPFTASSNQQICPKEPYLIVYLNKEGMFDYFTPSGKVVVETKGEVEKYTRTFRNPQLFVNSTTHQIKQFNPRVITTYNINTGLISETQGQYIEEILYSPMVYLIEFKKFPLNGSGFYNNYRTIPVIVSDKNFTRKTRLNDKSKISYTLKFEETTNKIRNIR